MDAQEVDGARVLGLKVEREKKVSSRRCQEREFNLRVLSEEVTRSRLHLLRFSPTCGESSEGQVDGGDPVQVWRYVVWCCPGVQVCCL